MTDLAAAAAGNDSASIIVNADPQPRFTYGLTLSYTTTHGQRLAALETVGAWLSATDALRAGVDLLGEPITEAANALDLVTWPDRRCVEWVAADPHAASLSRVAHAQVDRLVMVTAATVDATYTGPAAQWHGQPLIGPAPASPDDQPDLVTASTLEDTTSGGVTDVASVGFSDQAAGPRHARPARASRNVFAGLLSCLVVLLGVAWLAAAGNLIGLDVAGVTISLPPEIGEVLRLLAPWNVIVGFGLIVAGLAGGVLAAVFRSRSR